MFRFGCVFAYHNSSLMPFNLVLKNPFVSGDCDSEVYSKPQRTRQDKTHPDMLIRDNRCQTIILTLQFGLYP